MKEYINFSAKLNEIRLLLRHPLYKRKAMMIVEGGSDIRLFRSLLSAETVKIESIDGKRNLQNSVKQLRQEGTDNILGICDADFDHIDGKSNEYLKSFIFLTDQHDIEMMMFNSPSLDAFIDEYSNNENYEKIKADLKDCILRAAYSIGLIRLINHRYRLKLNFQKLNFNLFTNINELDIEIDREKLITHLLERSPSKSPQANSEFINSQYNQLFVKEDEDVFQICCGHDVTSLIAEIYRQQWASINTKLNQTKVESSLRLAYSLEYFSDTNLYKLLSKWSVNKGFTILA